MTIKLKIEDCHKDSRKLHTLVNNLTNKPTEESWPEHTNEDQLAEELANFFENKIQNIWDLLKEKPKYMREESDTPRLIRFAILTGQAGTWCHKLS